MEDCNWEGKRLSSIASVKDAVYHYLSRDSLPILFHQSTELCQILWTAIPRDFDLNVERQRQHRFSRNGKSPVVIIDMFTYILISISL
jgi:hypothetical protein